jgi:hypothetical protein
MASAAGTVYIASSASSLGIFLLLTAIVAGGLFLHAVDTGKTAL